MLSHREVQLLGLVRVVEVEQRTTRTPCEVPVHNQVPAQPAAFQLAKELSKLSPADQQASTVAVLNSLVSDLEPALAYNMSYPKH